ncbi:ribonuclease HIII [Mycoplasmopsis gallopavonis]|uniref:Ribonuclease n=1 Tax=Mycoplasmopsis gallopavonis TaxID=76629 RepID=A0A449AYJ5_9BACT|nr:ribonuclease HIII [Mycoplasmopsis gallopavonis]RIV16604.1 ribonuclease HIII [Mycoplasmopsis gallopavonis]VEU72619.1 ribonuclease HII [Mycoplasmopsis gallopavonis]
MKIFDNLEKFNLEQEKIIGVDETGVGDYFTPLIACAAFVPNHLLKQVKDLGVKDSKLLSEKQIIKIGKQLIQTIPHSIYRLSQEGYNKLSKFYNANEIKFIAHLSAINFILKKTNEPSLVLIDQYSTINSILKYNSKIIEQNNAIKIEDISLPALFAHKAESLHLSVACASIIARFILIYLMKEQNKNWNFKFPFGANKEVQAKVKEFEEIHGLKALEKVCKMNFKIKK